MDSNTNYIDYNYRPGWLMRQFWKACGADARILQKCSYKEHVKYACLGGIVAATGIMAGLAGGYAFYTIFSPKGSALDNEIHLTTAIFSFLFGILWGLIIFNLDRFIVTSTGQGDGTEAITKEELGSALPRIVMGIIIAITISKPMEIRIFKSEIDVALHKRQLEEQRQHLVQIDSIFVGRIIAEKGNIEKWKVEIIRKEERYVELENLFADEMSGKRGPGNYGPEARKLEQQLERLEKEITLIKTNYEPLIRKAHNKIEAFLEEKELEIENAVVVSNGLDGLLERIKLSHKIAGTWISLFITLLFVAIELTPIFFKLMLIKSPYDYLLDNENEIKKAESGILIKYDYYRDKQGRERDLIIYTKAQQLTDQNEQLLKAQKELNEYAIEQWLELEKAKIKMNPHQYVTVASNGADQ